MRKAMRLHKNEFAPLNAVFMLVGIESSPHHALSLLGILTRNIFYVISPIIFLNISIVENFKEVML